jgi:hypothetical protein
MDALKGWWLLWEKEVCDRWACAANMTARVGSISGDEMTGTVGRACKRATHVSSEVKSADDALPFEDGIVFGLFVQICRQWGFGLFCQRPIASAGTRLQECLVCGRPTVANHGCAARRTATESSGICN